MRSRPKYGLYTNGKSVASIYEYTRSSVDGEYTVEYCLERPFRPNSIFTTWEEFRKKYPHQVTAVTLEGDAPPVPHKAPARGLYSNGKTVVSLWDAAFSKDGTTEVLYDILLRNRSKNLSCSWETFKKKYQYWVSGVVS